MTVELVLFVLLGLGSLAGASTVVLARNPVHAAMGLLGTLFSLGVVYVVNLAHLVAAVQIIVYAGAVLTLFLFVIMLIGVDKEEDTRERLPRQRALVGGLAGITVVLGAALAVGGNFSWVPTGGTGESAPNGTIEAIGALIFTDWVLAFEATALLLTISAAGAIALAYFRRGGQGEVEE
jgi:NADH-quinone oxidoreductase subunit J